MPPLSFCNLFLIFFLNTFLVTPSYQSIFFLNMFGTRASYFVANIAWARTAPQFSRRFISSTTYRLANFNTGPGLDRIVKVELLEKETPQKITSIWVNYHHKKPCISAVLQKEQYKKIKDKATKWFVCV
jgi:hypothetical protein